MNITNLTVHELRDKIKNDKLNITDITKAYVNKIQEKEEDVQAFITTLTEDALEQASSIQKGIEEGRITGDFAGIPI